MNARSDFEQNRVGRENSPKRKKTEKKGEKEEEEKKRVSGVDVSLWGGSYPRRLQRRKMIGSIWI